MPWEGADLQEGVNLKNTLLKLCTPQESRWAVLNILSHQVAMSCGAAAHGGDHPLQYLGIACEKSYSYGAHALGPLMDLSMLAVTAVFSFQLVWISFHSLGRLLSFTPYQCHVLTLSVSFGKQPRSVISAVSLIIYWSGDGCFKENVHNYHVQLCWAWNLLEPVFCYQQ